MPEEQYEVTGKQWVPQLPKLFKWTMCHRQKQKSMGDASSLSAEAAQARLSLQAHNYSLNATQVHNIPGLAPAQLGWEVLMLVEKVMPGPAHV